MKASEAPLVNGPECALIWVQNRDSVIVIGADCMH